MKANRWILLASIVLFSALLGTAFWNELRREEAKLETAISGRVSLAPMVGQALVKTDNGYAILYEANTLKLAAVRKITTFVPPIAFQVGQEDALRGTLAGSYRLLVLTDKDGIPENPAIGELIGELSQPIALGTEGVNYVLSKDFRQLPQEVLQANAPPVDPTTSIQGVVDVTPELKNLTEQGDQLVIFLFDPKQGRPVAFRKIAYTGFPQKFQIGQEHAMPNQILQGEYSLRIVTDKNNQPFQSAKGEIIGRSPKTIPLGTQDLKFLLNQNYTR